MNSSVTKKSIIYGLADPITTECRYIGKVSLHIGMERRLEQHIQSSRAGAPQHVNNWIRQLLAKNVAPEIFEIEKTADWQESECFWIEYFRFVGCSLTNISRGGGIDMNQEIAAKISKTRKDRGLSFSPDQIAKSLATRAILWQDSNFKEERSKATSKAQKKLWADPKFKEKMRGVRRLQWVNNRELMSSAQKRSWEANEDRRKKVSSSLTEFWAELKSDPVKSKDRKQKLISFAEQRRLKNNGVAPQARLRIQQVIEIKRLLREGEMSQREIAQLIGTSPSTVDDIFRGKSWKHVK